MQQLTTDGCCVSPHFNCHVWHVTMCNYCSSLSRDASQYVTFVHCCGHASSHFIFLTSNILFAIYYSENALGLEGFIPLIFSHVIFTWILLDIDVFCWTSMFKDVKVSTFKPWRACETEADTFTACCLWLHVMVFQCRCEVRRGISHDSARPPC